MPVASTRRGEIARDTRKLSQQHMKTEPAPKMLSIDQVENGYIVNERSEYCASASRVFQSMAELIEFLETHFTHRSTTLLVDQP